MAFEITMPKLSDTMTEGSFISWRKSVGDRIERGDILAEVETDKAVMELEAFASGILIKVMAKEGETVPVGTVLGLIGEPQELTAEPEKDRTGADTGAAATAAVAEPPPAAPPAPEATEAPLQAALAAAALQDDTEHEKASPLVRRMARELGINLADIQGSGPEGRILQQDLAAASRTAAPPADASATPSAETPLTPQPGAVEQQSASVMRRAIAATVSRSWQEIPHFSVSLEIAMDACREVVSELKGSDRPLGYQALVIKACASALANFPLLLAAQATARDTPVNISFAVALADGLLMPVIRNCRNLSATKIEQEIVRLAEKARNGRLASEEMSGGNFSLSNLGMYGIDEFAALIMPGQAAILAMGAVVDRPAVRAGLLAVAPTLRVTLSSDHRTVDGAYAAAFLAELRHMLEHPVTLLV